MSTEIPTSDPAGGHVPAYLTGLVDDAAIFPPGNAPLPDAVAAHRGHRGAAYAEMVGPFLVGDQRLGDLLDELGVDPSAAGPTPAAGPLPVAVVVSGGAGAIDPAVRWATRTGALRLRSLEVAVRGDDTGELGHNARRVVTAVDQLLASGDLDDDVTVAVELPRLHGAEPGHGWLSALDEVAAADHRVKFRTGGEQADAFPDARELATVIAAALDRELAFKCTAGLHQALPHRDRDTGFDHHGFLTVLLATRASLDGASVDEVAQVLGLTDPDDVRRRLTDTGDGLARARRWFTSFGSCSVLEPLESLVDLDLLPSSLLAPPTPENR